MGGDEFEDIASSVAYLEMSNNRSGKAKFLRDYKLISKKQFVYIRSLSQLRNLVAHRIENVNFDLKVYYEECDAQKRREFQHLDLPVEMPWAIEESGLSKEQYDAREPMAGDPKQTIFIGAMAILSSLFNEEAKMRLDQSKQELTEALIPNVVQILLDKGDGLIQHIEEKSSGKTSS